MSNQIVISSGAKVRELEGVLTGTAGIVNALGINVPSGIPQLDGSGKILVSQLPNSVMEYKGTWNAATNTPTLADGTGNQGDVYLCNVAGTVNFGSGPIAFFVGDQVIYSGTIWQRASGATGTVTSVAVTESGDALSITGSPITTSGTINIGFTGTSGQYVNGAGGLTTFPTDNITGSGASGQVTYFNGTNTITGENAFNYDATTNRLGVNTTVPNATIGANAGTDSGYSLLLKNDNANYNGIGFGTDSTYGNLISTEKQGTATAKNLTLLNQSGFISLTEAGNLGVGLLTPNTGLDIYNGTSAYLWLHTATSGTSGTDGVRLALFNTNGANLRNFEGSFSITAEGDFSVITLGAENFKINSSDGSIYQSKVANAMLKSVSGVITAAVAGTDYLAPTSLSAYVPYTGATTNVNLGTHSLTAADLVINHSSGSGVAASITKGGAGEALTVVKTSGSGNAASITGGVTLLDELHLNTDLADAYIASAATWNAKIGGSGADGRVAYWNGTNSITSEAGFIYDASTNRLGVNTSVPNATIGADSALDSGYGLLIKTGSSNYNGIGISIDSTYGNLISTEKLGTATERNLTLLNQSGFVSLKENGSFGVNTLNPAVSGVGIDIYSSTSTGIRFHTATSGTTVSDGAGINFSAGNNLGITNYESGTIDIVTNGNSGVFIDSSGNVGIKGATPTTALTVNGGAAISALTTGQIVFPTSGGTLAGSSNLFWDNTNGKLGVGTSTLSGARVTISSSSEANHLQLVSNAPAMTFINAISYSYYATVGMATANNNFVTGAVGGDLVLGAYNTNNIWFYNANTNTVRMRIDSDGGGTFSGFVSASGPKSQIRVNGNSVGCGISLSNTIVGANRRNWGIFTEQDVEGDFVIKRSNASGGSAESGTSIFSLSRDGAATFSSNIAVGGSTLSAWASPFNVIQSHYGSYFGGTTGGSTVIGNNNYYDGSSYRYVNTDYATQYQQATGEHFWRTAISGTSGSVLTWSERMRITSGGNVGIGTSSPAAKLEIQDGHVRLYDPVSTAGAGYAVIWASNNGGTNSSFATIEGVTTSAGNRTGDIKFNTSSAGAPTERMRITSGGYFKASNNGSYENITGNYHELRNTSSDTVVRCTATNGSYTSTVVAASADRAASADYSLYGGWSGNFGDKEFNLRGDGNAYADGSWNGGGADYAEYFEWIDGNQNNEDRRGYSVSLVNNKIKIAEQGEVIIGVISGNPSIVGDAAWNKWSGKYLKDDFGSYILDEEGNRTLNPDYDENVEYIPREKRQEWGIVGLVGKLSVRKGQPTMPNWIKMKDISDKVEQWLIK